MTDTLTDKYRVVVGYDEGTESPEEYALFKVISFGRRHMSYQDPDVVLTCQHEDDEGYQCDELPWQHMDGESPLVDKYAVDNPITDHEYQPDPDILFILSYFEHSLCRWGLYGSMNGMPDFRWDGASLAGVLMWDPSDRQEPDTERNWWDNELSDERREEIASTFLEEYTDWCNGSVYWIEVQKWVPDVCGACKQPHADDGYWEGYESTGGIIGWDPIREVARDICPDLPEDFEIVEKGH